MNHSSEPATPNVAPPEPRPIPLRAGLLHPVPPLSAPVQTDALPPHTSAPPSRYQRVRPSLFFTLGMILMLLLIPAIQWVSTRVQDLTDQWHTGDARITALDADVGHGGISHFLGFYYHGSLVVIEITGHDETLSTHVYSTPVTPGDQTRRTVTLTVQPVSSSRRDLAVTVSGFSVLFLLVNTGDGFKTGQ